MKALDWQKFLQQQREQHCKVIFTPSEFANIDQANPGSLNAALRRLVKQGVLVRYAAGRYGLPGAAMPEDLVPALDAAAYITGMYALYRRQIVAQAPTEITCFTNRRHNKSRVRETALGRVVFMCVEPPVYFPPKDGAIASAEQALCDFVHICRKRGVHAGNMVSFKNKEQLDRNAVDAHLVRYPIAAQREVASLLD